MEPVGSLILHGAIVLLAGLLCGAPLGSAIVRHKTEETVRAWRVAHTSLVMAGMLLMLLGLVAPHLALAPLARALLAWLFIVSIYVLSIVLLLGARFGLRGLSAEPPGLNRAFYVANMAGAAGLVMATAILVWGAVARL